MQRIGWFALLLIWVVALPAAGQEKRPASAEAEDLIERERIRSTVSGAFELVHAREHRVAALEDFDRATQQVLSLGAAAVPFVIPDVESPHPDRFFFAAYTLGRLGGAEAEAAIRQAMDLADRDGGTFGRLRKAWSALALALIGKPEAVDLLDAGKTKAARSELYRRMTALEASALLTAPQSVPLLLQQLDRYLEDDELKERRPFVLAALRRIGDPSMKPKILELLGNEEEDRRVRRQCVKALGVLGGDEVVNRLMALLGDPDEAVRREAAIALEALGPVNKTQELIARLDTEEMPIVRRMIYRTLAEALGVKALRIFRSQWGKPVYVDRMWLVEATGRIGHGRAVHLLREAVKDKSSAVGVQAVLQLAEIDSPSAREALLQSLSAPSWPVRQFAIQKLAERRERRAGPRIAAMLLEEELPGYEVSAASRSRVTTMGEALVELRYTEPLEAIREALDGLKDPTIVKLLNDVIRKLEVLEAHKDDPRKWTETMGDPDTEVRYLAYERLGELADDHSVDALVRAFDTVPDKDRLQVLRALAQAASPRASPVIESVLSEPEFDLATRLVLRDYAAWAARRIGGERMVEALRRSVERREGRDYRVLAYLALLSGEDALPTLLRVRFPRVKYPRWDRGLEQEQLEWIIVRLSAGRSLGSLDVSPDKLTFAG